MLIDSHCHLDFSVFDKDRETLMLRCLRSGVGGFLVPATTKASWERLYDLSKAYSQWRVAYGVHPYFLPQSKLDDIDYLEQMCVEGDAIAVGEIGIDCWPGAEDFSSQAAFFIRQLSIAKNLNLPVIVHARKSYDLVFKIIRESKFQSGGIIHAFNGSLEQAKRFREYGFLLGIGGTVTYPRAKKARRILSLLENDSFVLETDSPDMPLCGFQGQRNTPLSIVAVADCVAEIRDENVDNIAQQTFNNLLRVFPKWHERVL